MRSSTGPANSQLLLFISYLTIWPTNIHQYPKLIARALFRNWPGNLEQTLGKIKAKPEVSRAATADKADKAAAGDPSAPPDLKSSRAATVPTPNGRQEAKGWSKFITTWRFGTNEI